MNPWVDINRSGSLLSHRNRWTSSDWDSSSLQDCILKGIWPARSGALHGFSLFFFFFVPRRNEVAEGGYWILMFSVQLCSVPVKHLQHHQERGHSLLCAEFLSELVYFQWSFIQGCTDELSEFLFHYHGNCSQFFEKWSSRDVSPGPKLSVVVWFAEIGPKTTDEMLIKFSSFQRFPFLSIDTPHTKNSFFHLKNCTSKLVLADS